MANITGLRYEYRSNSNSETPLFERQSNSEDTIEIHHLKIIVENLQRRVDSLEAINTDLEYRLEDQAKQSMALEKECMLIEQQWKKRNDELIAEIQQWKKAFETELGKGEKLRGQLSRTERELYGILQRKYELMRGPGTSKGASSSNQSRNLSNSDISALKKNDTLSSSWDASMFYMGKPPESKRARERKVIASLSDFLGF